MTNASEKPAQEHRIPAASPTAAPEIFCFGEMLWDSLPQGLFPGGAPMNVAYHLHRLGRRVAPLSAVGDDGLGDELLRRAEAWGLDTGYVRRLKGKPTGLVRVTLARGIPAYEILEDTAWDCIRLPSGSLREVRALIFGSLAQRSAHNRRTLAALRKRCGDALKVFDVNLRPPHDDPELVWSLADGADVLKLNDEEARRLLKRNHLVGELEPAALALSKRTGSRCVCITAGARGAGLLLDSKWTWVKSNPIRVKDTVGAGDSFLAAIVDGLLEKGRGPEAVLSFAARLAEFVASSEGATPPYRVRSGKIEAQ
jgi:fructokinase